MRRRFRIMLLAGLLLPAAVAAGEAATVKPLEIFSEKILASQIEYLSTEHILASSLLRKSVHRLNREMNIMSEKTAGDSLKLLADVSERLAAARKSSEALSCYLTGNSSRLKDSGHGRYLPLARMDKEIEGPYFAALETFLSVSNRFIRFCIENFDGISSGKKEDGRRYEELYAAYLKAMENFNDKSVARSQLLAEMGTEYPLLWELLPK